MLFGAIEAGGTKIRAAVLDENLTTLDEMRVPTTTPDGTLPPILEFLGPATLSSVGIASFGPLNLDASSPTYGSLASTPKPGWTSFPLLEVVRNDLGVPTEIQTDVEAAAVAEGLLGAGRSLSRVAYVTVGTGIGAAWTTNGIPYRGTTHAELGHIPVMRAEGDSFPGVCPFHSDCLEGMASGPAIEARWGTQAEQLDDPAAWLLEAGYLAQLCQVFTYSAAPDVIVFGGGVSQRRGLIDLVRRSTEEAISGYRVAALNMDSYIVPAQLGQEAGLIGAGLLAQSLTSNGSHH